jgi:hypothetical protein
MKLLFRCTRAAAIVSATATLVSALALDGPLTFVIWPGLVTVDAVYRTFGFYWDHSRSVLLLLLPAFVLNTALYAGLFLAVSRLWSIGDTESPPDASRKS